MPQLVTIHSDDRETHLSLPNPLASVIPGVQWGRFDNVFTPAFWFVRAAYAQLNADHVDYRLTGSLRDEVMVCLLGGYGMPAEVGLAAFHALRCSGVIEADASVDTIEKVLSEPLVVGQRRIKYRYPSQKARYISKAIKRLNTESAPISSDLELRAWLLTFDGIGPKTASWITRNHLGSDNVAILDVHIYRAGLLCGLFDFSEKIDKCYFQLEQKLVRFAQGLGLRLSLLDAVIWAEMRQMAWLGASRLSSLEPSKAHILPRTIFA